MFFRLMLWLLARRIEVLTETNPAFVAAIRRRVCVLQFETTGGRVARYFSFRAGATGSRSGRHERPSLTFRFSSAAVARRLILAMAVSRGDSAIMIDAINQGKLRLLGDISLLPWFMQIAAFFPPRRGAAQHTAPPAGAVAERAARVEPAARTADAGGPPSQSLG